MNYLDLQRPRGRGGFALPAVLAVTGVVTLIFVVALTALNSLNAEARSARERVRFLQASLTAEAQVAYMLATEPIKAQGVQIGGVIEWDENQFIAPVDEGRTPLVRTDGRPYLIEGEGAMVASLQDQSGLVNLTYLNGLALNRLFGELGVPENQFGTFQARLIDYQDSDLMRQPDGAEREAYNQGGPPNRILLSPSEILSVAGLRSITSRRRWNEIRPHLAADRLMVNINLNTATPKTMSMVLGLDERQINTLIQERLVRPISSTTQVDSLLGTQLMWDDDRFYTAPANAVILTLKDTRSAWIYRARLAITPVDLENPVWVDQIEMNEARGRARAETQDAIRLPYAPY